MRYILAAILGLAVVWMSLESANAYKTYPALDETASWIAQRPVTVHCNTVAEDAADINIAGWGAEAYVEVNDDGTPADYTVFKNGNCERLVAWATNTWYHTYSIRGLAWPLLVLTHESKHMRGGAGWMNEGSVNCWAIRHVRYTARHLYPAVSDSLSLLLRDGALWWFKRQQSPQYQKPGCVLPGP